MAKNENVRLPADTLQSDENAFLALKSITSYAPANPACALPAVSAAQEAELNAQNTLAAARDAAIAAQWEHHNLLRTVKDQVIAQFGADSDEVASLGLKKRSERKSPARARKAAK